MIYCTQIFWGLNYAEPMRSGCEQNVVKKITRCTPDVKNLFQGCFFRFFRRRIRGHIAVCHPSSYTVINNSLEKLVFFKDFLIVYFIFFLGGGGGKEICVYNCLC